MTENPIMAAVASGTEAFLRFWYRPSRFSWQMAPSRRHSVNGGPTNRRGRSPEPGPRPFESWIRPNERDIGHDAVLGSIGGSNHFVEIQRVARILDKNAARLMGLGEVSDSSNGHSG